MVAVPPLVLVAQVLRGEPDTGVLLVAATGTLFAVVQRSHDVITLPDADGTIVWIAPSIEERWSYRPHPLVDVVGELVHGDARPELRATLDRAAAGPRAAAERTRTRIHRSDGHWRDMEVVVTNHLDHPAIRAAVVIFHDVTERTGYERQLQAQAEAQSEIGEELRRVQAMKDTFLSAVSHDLRTPLTTIRGMSELLDARGGQLRGEPIHLVGTCPDAGLPSARGAAAGAPSGSTPRV